MTQPSAALFLIVLAAISPLPGRALADEDFALRDGDTVVFLGDSITAARTYGETIENYTILRYPDRQIRFFNAGRGGDTARGGATRLETDVFPYEPTVLTVAYGVNDIGWGMQADDQHRQAYLDGVRAIVSACHERGVRVFICSAAITAEHPDTAENGFLQTMCDDGLALARELGAGAIDVQRTMRTIQRRVIRANESLSDDEEKTRLHVSDGVHLNELGQLAMAYSILKGLGAPADVSSVTIGFDRAEVIASANCRVTALVVEKGDVENGHAGAVIEFTREDDGLPLTLGLFGQLQYRFVPIHNDLARYMLQAPDLPAGRWALTVDGRPVGTFHAHQLIAGVNIGASTPDAWQPGGPWDAQATSLASLTKARSELARSTLQWGAYLGGSHQRPDIDPAAAELDERLVRLQRRVARPSPYRYRLERIDDE